MVQGGDWTGWGQSRQHSMHVFQLSGRVNTGGLTPLRMPLWELHEQRSNFICSRFRS